MTDDPFDITDTLTELRSNAANETVDRLLDALQKEHALRIQLQNRVEDLEERMGVVEAAAEVGDVMAAIDTSEYDHRDRAVLQAVITRNPTKVNAEELTTLYRNKTDIMQDDTARTRIKHLTTNGPFEYLSPGTWRYLGVDAMD